MIQAFTKIAIFSAALALSACGASNTESAENAAGQPSASAATPASAEPNPARLAYLVSQSSPLLSEAQRTAISQDFNGAPLSGAPAIHTVTAERVACRARTQSVGEGVTCLIAYSETQTVEIGDPDARALYDALGALGVEDESGMSHLERAITALSCTVDDNLAQSTPSTGENVAGFACRFTP